MKRVLSLFAEDDSAVQRAFAQDAARVDAFELRLDRCTKEQVTRWVSSAPRAVIATVMPEAEGGHFVGSTAERIALLAAATCAGASYVDLDRELARDWCALQRQLGGTPKLLVSAHDRKVRTAADPLAELQAMARAFPGQAIKRVFHFAEPSECVAFAHALRVVSAEHSAPVIAFSMGEAGHASRVIARICGSAWTYLAADESAPTAVGQWTLSTWERTVPKAGLQSTTQIYGIVGRGVAGSLSPAVHNAWFQRCGADAVYLRFEPRDATAFFTSVEGMPGAPLMHGYSVTQPFKEAAWRFARSASAEANTMRAANTLVRRGAGWHAENTDAPAVRAVFLAAGAELSGATALILGAGGAARAAAIALRDAGAAVTLALRDPARAAAFAEAEQLRCVRWEERAQITAQILINATPMGSAADPASTPYAAEWIAPHTHVLDMVYRPRRTPLLRAAASVGAHAIEGLEMFLEQARRQTELFTGIAAPIEVLRRAAENALEAEGSM